MQGQGYFEGYASVLLCRGFRAGFGFRVSGFRVWGFGFGVSVGLIHGSRFRLGISEESPEISIVFSVVMESRSTLQAHVVFANAVWTVLCEGSAASDTKPHSYFQTNLRYIKPLAIVVVVVPSP